MSRTPISIGLATLSLMFAAAGSARADASYLLTLQGTDQRYYPPCRIPGQAPPCDVTVELPWTGTLRIVVDSNADGVFADADVLSFSFQTNLGSLVLPFMPTGSVTVSDGRVSSVDFNGAYPAGDGDYFFLGLQAHYDRNFDAPHTGADSAVGELTAVPEPGAAAVMLVALALAGAGAARLRRRPASRSCDALSRTA